MKTLNKDPFIIGNLKLKYRAISAPMAGLTDIAFRKLLDEIGCVSYMVSEMISVEGLIRQNARTFEMMKSANYSTPQFIQLFGENIESIGKAVKIVEKETDFSGIDFNMGCPARKVIKKGAGSALLQTPEKIKNIVSTMRNSTSLPITVKMRLGFDTINILENIEAAKEGGADAVAVHFRLRSNSYSKDADWGFAKIIKNKYPDIILIGNGDIADYRTGIEKLKIVNAIMIGRGAISNPLIFSEICEGKSLTDKKNTIFLRLMDLIDIYYEEKFKIPKLKAFVRYMVSRKSSSKYLRAKLYTAKSLKEARKIFIDYYGINQF